MNHSNRWLTTEVNPRPQGYQPGSIEFPALYWPFPTRGAQTRYLYTTEEIWRFTLYWTLICVVGVHMVAAAYAVAMQYRNWRIIWVVPLVYLLVGGVEGAIAGNAVGGL
jgi:hypothetical protein